MQSIIKDLRVLVVLQNGYYARSELAQGFQYHRWLREFLSSRSGSRMAVMFGGEHVLKGLRYCNTTPRLGNGPGSELSPDERHVRRILRRVRPHYTVACGTQAEDVVGRLCDGNVIAIPHPTYRLLTDRLLKAAGDLLAWHAMRNDHPELQIPEWTASWVRNPSLRAAVRQRRGQFEIKSL
jgi:hypothetical protein